MRLPDVIADLDGRILALDEAIRDAAIAWQLQYAAPCDTYLPNEQIPEVAYALSNHFTRRGFSVRYDGDAGTLTVHWDAPNMSYLDMENITRAYPDLIQHLGIGFSAAHLYLCMTNGNDLRKHTNQTILRQLEKSIQEAATLGNTELSFGFPDVPAPVVGSLFAQALQTLVDIGFIVTYLAESNVYLIKWGETLPLAFTVGEHGMTVALD